MDRALGITAVFGAMGVCSGAVSVYRWAARGKVALGDVPEDSHGCMPSFQDGVFDIARPDDFIDGQPLDEAAFWARIRWHKIALAVFLAAAAASFAGKTGYSEIVQTAFAVYLALVAVVSACTTDRGAHAYYTMTLAVLTTSTACILMADALIPGSAKRLSAASWYPNPTLALYLAASALALAIPSGPELHFPPENIYSDKVTASARIHAENNVNGSADASPFRALFFTYISKILTLPAGFGVADLPLLTADMRAPVNFSQIRADFRRRARLPAGVRFGCTLLRVNALPLIKVQLISTLVATARYAPAYLIRRLLLHLESDDRDDDRWGYVYVAGLFASGMVFALGECSSRLTCLLLTFFVGPGWGQLWSLAHIAGVRIISQTNTLLFMKTLVRKDAVAVAGLPDKPEPAKSRERGTQFAHKAQILTLMSQDVHRVADLSKHVYTLTDSSVQLVLGTWLLHSLLGTSCFVGLGATLICLPLQHFTGNIIISTQAALMKAKDERILAGIRMIKFMAWERKFEARLWGIREKELARQKITFTMKTLLTVIGNSIPMLFALASFGHYTVVRHEVLTPSVAFTAITIFNGIQYAISSFPEAFLAGLQCIVSLRWIDEYLDSPEISAPARPPRAQNSDTRVSLASAVVTWPMSAGSETPFALSELSLDFPVGELSLVCGKVGSGKSLLLLTLLGEAEVVAGEITCPRSAPDCLAGFTELPASGEWVVAGVCAYVPQTSWLRNQSIRDNILFELPFCAERYAKTLEVCALVADLEILEYGDLSEVGERGINLSGGQKARVSLARAVYSRASILILDDILSAVDVHTAHHIYHACLKGELMRGRTVILVSHHIQLCADGAAYIVALDRGTVGFKGGPSDFRRSNLFRSLLQTKTVSTTESQSDTLGISGTSRPPIVPLTTSKSLRPQAEKGAAKAPKLVADETSSVGRIHLDVWTTYLRACGRWIYWIWFAFILLVACFGPVFENGYLRTWSDAGEGSSRGPIHYLLIYAAILCIALLFRMAHFLILYSGSIHASRALYKKLLETVLFSNIRFHDTIARGSLLNRFGKDFQIIDGFIADDFGRALKLGVSVVITFSTITVVGGLPFLYAASALGLAYYFLGKDYGHTSRDMRRLVSTTTSPLYSVYETAISGVIVIRSFGGSTTFLRDMMRSVDANSCACHWQYGLNRWFSVLSTVFGGTIVAIIALIVLLSPNIDPSLAGMALVFASMVAADLMYFVRTFVGLEQCLVAVERVKETSDLAREPPEILEPRPPATWPSKGEILCQDLSIRYAPNLPDVLHDISFQVVPGEKIGVVGRTGSGKSTLALSFFRFVEASQGKLVIDGIDIATLGLTDLRRNLTIIPQEPTLMSGTLRSTLDVFDEHEDVEIFEALRRVHLISDASQKSGDASGSVFNKLDSPVSQGGGNFSAGVDYATDELIGLTIREKFHGSTILTIAHRLRSIIDYDKVIVLDEGRIVEFDRPRTLLQNSDSTFYKMCKATGSDEFATLRSMAGI
ncbi:multidrug resistance-associated ABC transporter [Mycena latifolia]|nr:multidrug resistance-associated ABC transporter [Mycena latifolia]